MKKILLLSCSIILCLSACLWFGCKEEEKELPGSIHGFITDKATGEPIKTAGVELQPTGSKTVTGSDGQYEFKDIDAGTYKLHITKTGYTEFIGGDIVVKANESKQIDEQLEKLPPALRIVNDKKEDIDSLNFGEVEDDITRSFNIFNDGIESLEWDITKTAEWITSVSKMTGVIKAGGTQSIILTIDRSKLKSGRNVTTVHITSNDGSKQLKVIAIGENLVLPTLNTLAATDVKRTSAVFHGELLNVGQPSYHERGFVYSLSSMPTVDNTISKLTVAITTDKNYQATATNLEEGKTYYIRAYAINKAGVAYSTNEVNCQPQKTLASVKTEAITNKSIANGTATLNATIVDAGQPAYTERGFVYGISHNPMTEDANVTKKAVSGQGTGAYSVNLTNLQMGAIYYVRAYVVSELGTAYGNEVEMDFNLEKPIIQTKSVGEITPNTATLYAEIQSIGDPAYTEAGFVYGTMPNPAIDESGVTKEIVTGTGIGIFQKKIENLTTGETYYVRAFLRNEHYTVYGEIKSFVAREPQYITLPEHNLMIQKSASSNKMKWHDAFAMCKTSTIGGYTDWRLPTKDELMIIYQNKSSVSIPFDNYSSRYVWSSTEYFYGSVCILYWEGGSTAYYDDVDVKDFTIAVRSINLPDNTDSYVILPELKLMVQKNDLGTSGFNAAKNMCAGSNAGGFTDWRLPTEIELSIIYENRSKIGNFQFETETTTSCYWSSTVDIKNRGYHYYIDFSDGKTFYTNDGNSRSFNVRAVRTITQ